MVMGRLIGTLALVGAGIMIGRAMRQDAPAPLPAKPTVKVRDAGPDAMKQPPNRWDMIDQQADESFPASDPPGNY